MNNKTNSIKTKLLATCFIVCILLANKASAQWSELGGVNALAANGSIISICTDASGNIYAAGSFTDVMGKRYIAKYDGSRWSEVGDITVLGAISTIPSICADASGNIYAAIYVGNIPKPSYVAKYDGSTWSELGGINSMPTIRYITTICADPSGNIYAAGQLGYCVAKYNGSTWSELCGINSSPGNPGIYSVYSDASGNVYTGGEFTYSNSMVHNNMTVGQWNGSNWSKLGSTIGQGANNNIYSICSDPSGNIYAAGYFGNDSSGMRFVAKYNGSYWIELGGTNSLAANGPIESIHSDAQGNIYAAGWFTNGGIYPNGHRYVAKYNGSTWSELGGTNALAANSYIWSICSDIAGNIYAAGTFWNNSGYAYVAKYNTGNWNEFVGTYISAPKDIIRSVSNNASSYVYAINGPSSNRGPTNEPKHNYKAGITEIQNPSYLRLYPNPASDAVTISYQNGIKAIKVLNQTGEVVRSIENLSSDEHILRVGDLAKGIYYVLVTSNDGVSVQKLAVE